MLTFTDWLLAKLRERKFFKRLANTLLFGRLLAWI